jgi:sterol O-acyltransferase
MAEKGLRFQPRHSYFDALEPRSWINNNEMRGFYVMFNIVSICYILGTCTLHLDKEGFLLEGSFFTGMMKDFKVILVLWPSFFAWSWNAYFLQLLVLKGLPKVLTGVIQHATQSLMFITAWYLVYSREWEFCQTVFVTFLALVHFMKMHSFTLVNRDLRKAWLKDPKSNNGYPANLTPRNFLTYMVCPVLVYQVSYPSTPKFRIGYFLTKTCELTLKLVLLYIIVEDHIMPVLRIAHTLKFLECYSRLLLPCILFYLVFFESLFDHILNLFAELGQFADREFYTDWWNCSGWTEFNRKWNRPVHLFLYTHVYRECIDNFGWSPTLAKFTTFLFSSLCHEMVAAMILRVIKPYLMAFMLLQLPLMVLFGSFTESKAGMYLFWLGICTGPPLIITLYLQT